MADATYREFARAAIEEAVETGLCTKLSGDRIAGLFLTHAILPAIEADRSQRRDWTGCGTGDCPHEKMSDCIDAMSAELGADLQARQAETDRAVEAAMRDEGMRHESEGCNYGSLCPWCEIATLRSKLEAAKAEGIAEGAERMRIAASQKAQEMCKWVGVWEFFRKGEMDACGRLFYDEIERLPLTDGDGDE